MSVFSLRQFLAPGQARDSAKWPGEARPLRLLRVDAEETGLPGLAAIFRDRPFLFHLAVGHGGEPVGGIKEKRNNTQFFLATRGRI